MSTRPALKRSRIVALGAALLAAVLVLFVVIAGPSSGAWRSHILPDRIALRSALEAPDQAMLRQVYATRGFQPIWLGSETRMNGAQRLVLLLATSDKDGLTPARYGPQALETRLRKAWRSSFRERARTELLLTAAYIAYVHDLHTPAVADDLAYTDRDLQPSMRDRAEIARQLAGSASPQVAIGEATRMNALYVQMRDALAQRRTMSPKNDPVEPGLLLNMDRLRALPSKLGERFVLVDVAANRLWLYQDDQPVDSMKVIVGAPNEQTPQMAALIRYALYNPFWNVPPDLTRDTYAPRIAANLSALADMRMDAWSGFTARAQVLNPRAVNWTAVSRGAEIGWLRQRPGPTNSMGAAKFMLPNALGIYLHDTPNRELFDKEARFFSAGCIRVEDYRRLSRWLFRGAEITAQGPAAEQRFDLPAPVPVYIVYLTARVEDGAIQVQPDVYGRDLAPPPAPTPPPALAVSPANPRATAPQPALPIPPTVAVERSPENAAPASPRPVPSPRSPPVAAPVPTTAAPRLRALAPTASPGPPAATTVRSPAVTAPASPRPTPPPRSAPVPTASVPKVQPARPAAAPVPQPAAVVTQRPAPPPAPIRAAGTCRIQAGVFGQRANADNLAKTMQPLGDVRVTEVQMNGAVAYSVVLAGLPSRRDAESALARLNSSGAKLSGPRITGCPATAN